MSNGKPQETPESFLTEFLDDYCKSKEIAVKKNFQLGTDASGRSRIYTALLTKSTQKLGILVRSQTAEGTTDKKLVFDAYDFHKNQDLKSVIVVVGDGWRPQVIETAKELCSVYRGDEMASFLEVFFG